MIRRKPAGRVECDPLRAMLSRPQATVRLDGFVCPEPWIGKIYYLLQWSDAEQKGTILRTDDFNEYVSKVKEVIALRSQRQRRVAVA